MNDILYLIDDNDLKNFCDKYNLYTRDNSAQLENTCIEYCGRAISDRQVRYLASNIYFHSDRDIVTMCTSHNSEPLMIEDLYHLLVDNVCNIISCSTIRRISYD